MVEDTEFKQPNNNKPSDHAKKRKKSGVFEFCKVCNRNHDLGSSHKYIPSHVKSLSLFLSRFKAKLSEIRFFLDNPSVLRPEHSSRNRFWCAVCDSDIDEIGSSFACANTISHLANLDHLKNLKEFLWKQGGSMSQVDSFRVLEKDLAKWEKKCEALKREDNKEECRDPVQGPLNDIHNELESQYIDSYPYKNNKMAIYSNISNGVVPLQNYTNERFQVLDRETTRVIHVGSHLHKSNPILGQKVQFNAALTDYKDLVGEQSAGAYVHNDTGTSGGRIKTLGQHNLTLISPVIQEKVEGNGHSGATPLPISAVGGFIYIGQPDMTRISSVIQEEVEGNVHSGEAAPWLISAAGSQSDVELKSLSGTNNVVSVTDKPRKSKLNPNRVGAEWAERRKIEFVTSNCHTNWLPNFGRVWQSGSRKKSKKEFQVENCTSLKVDIEPERPIVSQPYISKRMCNDASG